ncbi:MAG: ABC transporter substrate-binding protein, partial [Spirochaetota bacterium]
MSGQRTGRGALQANGFPSGGRRRRGRPRGSPPRRRVTPGLLLLAAACLLPLSGGRGSPEPVLRLGVIAPLSGELAILGRSTEEGARLAVEEINQNGGVTTPQGRLKLE